MHDRWLALPLAALTGCATATYSSPRPLPNDLQLGGLTARTAFELDDRGAPPPSSEPNVPADEPETAKQARRRKVLFFLGVGATGFGTLGVTSFGIGGRVVQAQLANGYDDGSLTRDREDTLTTTGEVMNGLAIGSAAVGLAGVILASTMYGIDHARCGDLPPRREHCPGRASADEE